MKYIEGKNRNQLVIFPTSLNETIDMDNDVRLIELFVESLDLADMGFNVDVEKDGGQAYHPKDLLKLYLYGYHNRIRSSRKLEKEAQRNLEVIWLLKGLSPNYGTILNFRRDYSKAIKKVLRATSQIHKRFNA